MVLPLQTRCRSSSYDDGWTKAVACHKVEGRISEKISQLRIIATSRSTVPHLGAAGVTRAGANSPGCECEGPAGGWIRDWQPGFLRECSGDRRQTGHCGRAGVCYTGKPVAAEAAARDPGAWAIRNVWRDETRPVIDI